VPEAHEPAVVLGRLVMARDHRPLPGGMTLAEADHRLVTGLPVDPDEVAAHVGASLVVTDRGAVPPPVRAAHQALVHAGELEGLVTELLLVRGAGREVERPTPQQRRAVVRSE